MPPFFVFTKFESVNKVPACELTKFVSAKVRNDGDKGYLYVVVYDNASSQIIDVFRSRREVESGEEVELELSVKVCAPGTYDLSILVGYLEGENVIVTDGRRVVLEAYEKFNIYNVVIPLTIIGVASIVLLKELRK